MIRLDGGRLVALATSLILLILLTNVDRAFQMRVAIESLADTGDGSPIRQIAYLLAMVCAAGLVVRQFSFGGLVRLFPTSLILLFLWAATTLLWSPVPDIGTRRLALTAVTTTTIFCLASLQSPAELLRRFRQVAVALALVSLLLVFVAPELAVHQPNDPERAVIGDWRGVFYHKNIFGSILAPAALIAFYERLTRPYPARGQASLTLLFLIFMLFMSGSKTSIGLGILMMGLLWTMHQLRRRPGALALFGFASYLAALVTVTTVILWMTLSGTATVVEEDSFTGRGLLWNSLLRLAEGHLTFGLGYQSVFQTGLDSPLATMFSERYLLTVAHAHSAYLEALITIGWIGLALWVVALVILPFTRLLRLPSDTPHPRLLILVLMLLAWLHGLLESGLFDRDRIMWIVFLLAYGALRKIPKERA